MILAMGMYFRKFVVATFALLLWSHPASAAKDPIYLEPSSQWILRYEDDACKLIRTFGEDENKVVVVMSRYGPGDPFNLTLAGKPVKVNRNRRDIKIQFGAHEGLQKIQYMSGTMSDLPALIILDKVRIAAPTAAEKAARDNWKPDSNPVTFGEIDDHRYTAAEYLLVNRPHKAPVYLVTGSLGKPFAAFSNCIDELLSHWGIDVEKHKNLSRSVTPLKSPARWVRPKDYPVQMLRQGRQAIVEFRLSVGPDGKATQCHIQQSTRPQEFDDAVCKSLLKRAEFDPALDADGNPIASFWRNTVQFQIPR